MQSRLLAPVHAQRQSEVDLSKTHGQRSLKKIESFEQWSGQCNSLMQYRVNNIVSGNSSNNQERQIKLISTSDLHTDNAGTSPRFPSVEQSGTSGTNMVNMVPMIDEPSTGEPATREPATGEPATEQPAIG